MDEILAYFPKLSTNQIQQFQALEGLYNDWNQKINVISRKNSDKLYEQHVLHSLAIAKFVEFTAGSKILDIGTGGGFPGIPLAIYFPEVSFVLVDSIAKKIKVVQSVADDIGLKNLEAYHLRAEAMKGKFDFAVTRAVAPMNTLVQWTQGKISEEEKNPIHNGLIALKGGDLKEELKKYKKKVEVVPISNYYSQEFFDTKKIVYLPL